MRDAFRAAYPPERSLPARIFLPAVHPRTFLRALHLGMMFPLGIAYFTVLVTAFALGGAMIWTIVGPVVLLITLYLTRWAGDAEAWVVRRVSSIPLRRPPTAIERGQSFREQVKTRLIDPTSWTGLAYLFIQFPVGIVSFVVLVTGGAVSAFLVSAPFYVGLADRVVDEPRPLSIDLLFWSTSDATMTEAMWMLPGGVLAYLLTMHLITAGSALHASWARLMLGSRAEPVAMMSRQAPPTGPSPDDGTPSETPGPATESDDAPEPSSPGVAPATSAATEMRPAEQPAAASELLPELVAPRLVASSEALDELTAREREVLTLIARGYSNAAIAETFVISEGTVKTHVKRVLAKLELRDRTQAAIYAYETGFVGLALSEVGATSNEPIPIVRARAR
jgi:DNA-binding CsgD family transcriptional regulator